MTVTPDNLRAAVVDVLALPHVGDILQLNRRTRAGAFEAYVFALVVRAVRQAGGCVEIWGAQSGVNPNSLVFRGSPRQMGSVAQDFCYAKCDLNGRKFEIHVDVVYTGVSGAIHELDVSMYEGSAGRARFPNTRRLLGAFECKCYDGHLDTNLGRAFFGLVSDCGSVRARGFLTNGRNRNLARYFSKRGRPDAYFDVSPVVSGHADRFVRSLEQTLRKWASVT